MDTPQLIESLQGTSVDKVFCGRQYTALVTQENALYVFGMSQLVKQPTEQLEPESYIGVCPYSDSLVFSKSQSICRIGADGSHTSVAMGTASDGESQEILMAFAVSDHTMNFLLKDKQTTPTVHGGCANLSMHSSMVSK